MGAGELQVATDERRCANCESLRWMVALGRGVECARPENHTEDGMPRLVAPSHTCDLFEPRYRPAVSLAVCPFCSVSADRVVFETPLVVGLWDGFPVTDGHALVVPRRHVASWFDATAEEQAALLDGATRLRATILARGPVDGWNLGINDGAAAGQTVGHLHLHVIPRRVGDVEDPRGGVRWVVPARARYWP